MLYGWSERFRYICAVLHSSAFQGYYARGPRHSTRGARWVSFQKKWRSKFLWDIEPLRTFIKTLSSSTSFMFLEERWYKFYLLWIPRRSNVAPLVSKYFQTPTIPSDARDSLKTFRGIIDLWNYGLTLLMWTYCHCDWLDLVVVYTPNGNLVRLVSMLTRNGIVSFICKTGGDSNVKLLLCV